MSRERLGRLRGRGRRGGAGGLRERGGGLCWGIGFLVVKGSGGGLGGGIGGFGGLDRFVSYSWRKG